MDSTCQQSALAQKTGIPSQVLQAGPMKVKQTYNWKQIGGVAKPTAGESEVAR